MEDLSKKLLSLEELNPRFKEEEIRRVLKNNYEYSSDLLKDRLSNARILFTSSTRNYFSILTFTFASIAVILSLWNFNQNYETPIEIFKFLTSLGVGLIAILLFYLSNKLIGHFGTDFRELELEIRIIPFILDYKSRKIKK